VDELFRQRISRNVRRGPLALARGAARYAGYYRQALVARRALRRQLAGVRTLEEAYDLAHDFREGLRIGPAQLRSEFLALLRIVEREQPRTLLEIGTLLGGTLFLFARAAPDDALLVSVDLPLEASGRGYHESRRLLYRSFARERQRVRLVQQDSHDPASIPTVRRALEGRPVDLLFIDDGHLYEEARADWELWSPLVRPGGIVAFHDIWPGAISAGVPQLWREVRDSGDAEEIVESPAQENFGIGVLRLPN
jgi:predicted O-methyltransferase YrrM